MKKILIATDFSENSDKALAYATFLAKKLDASLLVIHLHFPIVQVDPTMGYDTINPVIQQEIMEIHQKQLKDLESSMKDKKIKVESELISGGLSSSIAEIAQEKKADLIIVGKTPGGDFFDRLIGSTAAHVVANVSIPVLIVPANSEAPAFKKLMYGTELEANENPILTKVFAFAKPLKAKVELVKVYVEFEPDIQDDKQLLSDIEKKFSKEGFSYSTTKASDVSEGLLKSAHQHKADLIIIAGQHHSFLEELVNPSKSKEIINKTDIPLLVYDMSK